MRWIMGRLARAGKVKWQTPIIMKKDRKKKKNGRAGRRIQYAKKILSNLRTSNRTPYTSPTYTLHSKIPRVSCSNPDPTGFPAWIQRSASPPNQYIAEKHNKIQKRTFFSGTGSFRVRTHTQKNKGSTGKSIQRERNEASKIRVSSVLYGEEYERKL